MARPDEVRIHSGVAGRDQSGFPAGTGARLMTGKQSAPQAIDTKQFWLDLARDLM
jgi:hypothetical protein